MVVVLPVPLTPTTSSTLGSARTSSVPGSPSRLAISSASAAVRSVRSWRASSRCTSSAVARTPTSARISASSSRSQAASSPGSKAADASSAVNARRLFESESRKREKRPLRSASGSGCAFSSPSSSAQLRGNRDGLLAGQAPGNDLRDPVGAHGHPVQDIRGLHRPLLVRDDDELRAIGVAAQQLDEAADVRVVERRLDLVEQIERARPREEEREEEGDRAEGLFAAGEEREPLHTLPGGTQLDLDAGLVRVVAVLLGLGEP